MAPLGALTLAWTSAEASLPLGWRMSGLYRVDELSVALSEGEVSAATMFLWTLDRCQDSHESI